jgi:hypothetical protein
MEITVALGEHFQVRNMMVKGVEEAASVESYSQ